MFRIKNQQTGQSVESPLAKVLREGMIVGVANHSLLLRRDGTEIPIDDTPKGGHIAVRTFNADAALCVSFTDTVSACRQKRYKDSSNLLMYGLGSQAFLAT